LGLNSKHKEMPINERFLALLLANQKRIYAFIAMLLPRAADVDDIMQETLITMWRKFEDFESGSNFAAWSIRIARYKIMELRRKRAKTYIQFSDKAFNEALSRTEKIIHGIDDRIQALQNCITKLGKRDRDLIRMRYEQDTTTQSFAERIGEPADRIYKIMARIHNWLGECVRRTLAAWEVTG
jgi:RNA polymerase sigma-70 factor (ECF subfamily)